MARTAVADIVQIGDTRFGREIGKLPLRHRFVWDSCEVCGKERWVMLIKGMPQRLRCFQCRRGRPQLPRPFAVCRGCGCEFTNRQLKHNLENGWGIFCSHSCHMVWKRANGVIQSKPSGPEIALINLIKIGQLPFRYTGNGDVWLGNRNPDFINTNGKKQVVEMFGDYWHSESDVVQRTIHYEMYGFHTLVIWEHELGVGSDLYSVIEKIEVFSDG